MINHPLPIGTRIRTLNGECDDEEDEIGAFRERHAAPGEIGSVIHEPEHSTHQGWIYSIVFSPSEVWVFLDESEVNDPTRYEVLKDD